MKKKSQNICANQLLLIIIVSFLPHSRALTVDIEIIVSMIRQDFKWYIYCLTLPETMLITASNQSSKSTECIMMFLLETLTDYTKWNRILISCAKQYAINFGGNTVGHVSLDRK